MASNLYVMADIEGKEADVTAVVQAYVDSNPDPMTLQGAVDYVMSHKPLGVSRVDGYCIAPILTAILNPPQE